VARPRLVGAAENENTGQEIPGREAANGSGFKMKAQPEGPMLGPGSRWQRNHEPKAGGDSWKNSRTSTRKKQAVTDSPTEENQQQQKNLEPR
jgi:hypothetical protein